MPEYIVETIESGAGTYRVKAATREEAKAKFGNPKIDWEGVEQVDYQAFEVVVEHSVRVPPLSRTQT